MKGPSMKAPQATPTLEDLLHRDAGAIRAWVKNVRAGELEPPRGFNWLGLAEVAAFNARRDAARERARAWREGSLHREDTRQVNRVRQLRRIKNRLAPLALLAQSGQLRPAPTLQAWLSLREHLP